MTIFEVMYSWYTITTIFKVMYWWWYTNNTMADFIFLFLVHPRPRPGMRSHIRPYPAPAGYEKTISGTTLISMGFSFHNN